MEIMPAGSVIRSVIVWPVATAHLLIRRHYDCFNERRFADGADLFSEDCPRTPPFGQKRVEA
jgi:hypothetical protein